MCLSLAFFDKKKGEMAMEKKFFFGKTMYWNDGVHNLFIIQHGGMCYLEVLLCLLVSLCLICQIMSNEEIIRDTGWHSLKQN